MPPRTPEPQWLVVRDDVQRRFRLVDDNAHRHGRTVSYDITGFVFDETRLHLQRFGKSINPSRVRDVAWGAAAFLHRYAELFLPLAVLPKGPVEFRVVSETPLSLHNNQYGVVMGRRRFEITASMRPQIEALASQFLPVKATVLSADSADAVYRSAAKIRAELDVLDSEDWRRGRIRMKRHEIRWEDGTRHVADLSYVGPDMFDKPLLPELVRAIGTYELPSNPALAAHSLFELDMQKRLDELDFPTPAVPEMQRSFAEL